MTRGLRHDAALSYRKLFDGTDFQASVSALDMLEVGARFRSYHTRPIGPLSVVLPPDKADLFARMLGILAAADRPMRSNALRRLGVGSRALPPARQIERNPIR